ncbi:PREDICTED: uncharacterized protein LOC109465952 [Branchiostoma belcheri]|uniref:Uncharacterized protein LOC109465952 n=1 Tax=Branchiostoma belcheri TaxID=7741 RepID=A0A6P4XQT5_BRABE|nr:PREDICTED: uncharacterized protein LOC109465952 [Branchiostoma belcheri]
MIRSMGGSLEAEFEKQKAQRRRQEHKNMEDQMRKNRIDRVFLDKEYTHVEWMRRRNLHEYDLAQEKIIDQLARIYARQCQIAEEKLAKKEEEERNKRLRIEQKANDRTKTNTKRPKTTDSGRSRRAQLTSQFSRTSLGRPATSSFPRSQGPAERAQTPMSEPRVSHRGSLSKAMPPRSQSRVSFAQPQGHRTAWGDDDSDRISEISDVSSSSDETRRPPMKVEVRSLATPAQNGGKSGSVGPSVPPATTISQPNPFQKKRLVTPPTILVLHQKLDLFDAGGDKNQKSSMHRLSPAEQDFIRKKYRQKHECLMQERQRRLKARAQSAPPAAVERNRFGSVSKIEELNLKSSSEKPWVEYWREKLLS